jgi:hypothetical protein
MKNKIVLLLISAATFGLSATPAGITFQGRLTKSDQAVEGSSVNVTIKVKSVVSECLLYEETHTLNMSNSDGIFSIKIGGGTRTVNDVGLSLTQVFSNTGTAITSLICTGPGTPTSYTSTSVDARNVYVSFDDGVDVVAFADPYVVQSVPYAIEAERLAGKPAADYLQVSADSTQTKLDDIMDSAVYSEILALAGGTSSNYMRSSASEATTLPVLSGNPSTLAAGKIWYEGGSLKYYDAQTTTVKTIGTGSGSGTVTSVAVGSGLSSTASPITATGTISIATGGVAETMLADDAVSFDKIQNISTNRILGRSTASSGSVEQLSLGAGLSLSSGVLNTSIGTAAGQVMGADAVTNCSSSQKLQMSLGPTYSWSCVDELWTTDGTNVSRSSGSVGIGTTSPAGLLNVHAASGSDSDFKLSDGDVAHGMTLLAPTNVYGDIKARHSTKGGLDIFGYNDDGAGSGLGINGVLGSAAPTSTVAAINFNATKKNTTSVQALSATDTAFQFSTFLTPLMTVMGNGNVGIGTASPAARLHVADATYVNDPDYSGQFYYSILAGNGATTPDSQNAILMGSGSFGNNPMVRMTASGGTKGYIGFDGSAASYFMGVKGGTVPLKFKTNGADRMTIQSDGNVGIGTTSIETALEVSGGVSLSSSHEKISAYTDTSTAYTIPDATLNIRRLQLTGNATITLPAYATYTNKVYSLTLFLKQDATGSRTVTFAGNGSDTIKWDSGVAPVISTTASKISIIQLMKPSDETVWYGSMVWREN